MALIFAVFFVATLAAVMAADDNASRIARLTAFARRADRVGRALADRGAEVIEHAVNVLASDTGRSVSLDELLRGSGAASAGAAQGRLGADAASCGAGLHVRT
jgi:hypothetical protein